MAPPSGYGVGAFSLPIPHGMHLVAQLSFARLGNVSSQQDTSPKRTLAGTLISYTFTFSKEAFLRRFSTFTICSNLFAT